MQRKINHEQCSISNSVSKMTLCARNRMRCSMINFGHAQNAPCREALNYGPGYAPFHLYGHILLGIGTENLEADVLWLNGICKCKALFKC
jgi:hypothetical protein